MIDAIVTCSHLSPASVGGSHVPKCGEATVGGRQWPPLPRRAAVAAGGRGGRGSYAGHRAGHDSGVTSNPFGHLHD
jgi:hypothetical protein